MTLMPAPLTSSLGWNSVFQDLTDFLTVYASLSRVFWPGHVKVAKWVKLSSGNSPCWVTGLLVCRFEVRVYSLQIANPPLPWREAGRLTST